MKRLAVLLALLAALLPMRSPAYQITLPNNFINGQVIDASQIMANSNTIVQVINGGLDHTNVNTAVGFWASDLNPPTSAAATVGGTLPFQFPNGIILPGSSAASPLCTDANKQISTSCAAAAVVTSVTANAPLASSGGATPVISLSGTVGIGFGGTNNTTFTTNKCLRYDGTEIASASGDCVVSVTAGTNITLTGTALAPVINTVTSPTFGTVTANTQYNYTTATTCGAGTTGTLYSVNTAGPQGVNQTGVAFKCGTTNLGAADASGNWGFTGNVTAANFFNGSRAAYKTDWHPFVHFDALDVIAHERFGTYRYKPQYGDPQDLNVGFLADDSPAWVAGPKHDREDLKAQANIDAVAIQQLEARLRTLEREVKALRAQHAS